MHPEFMLRSSRTALRIAAAYFIAGTLWILVSDRLLERWVASGDLGIAQTIKGWSFMAVVSLLLFFWVRRALTERHTSASNLRATAANLRILLEQSLTGVFVIRDGRFIYVNERMAEIFGYSPDKLLGERFERVVYEGERARVIARVERTTGRRQSELFGFRGVRADGSVLHVEAQSTLTEIDGEPAILGIVLDVTQRKVVETQYQAARRLEALGRMAGGVAHDFNNLLTAISGAADLLRSHDSLPAECREDLEFILQTTDRGATLSRQLLAFSRNRAQHVAPIDVNATIAAVQPLLMRLVDSRIRLRVELDDRVRPILADQHQLEQIVLNLALNARDAMTDGGVLTITTKALRIEEAPPEAQAICRDDHLVRLTVQDSGVGIPVEVQPHIFEPFFTTKGDSGTGLGLATVQGIVAQTGGYILLESEPGRTCFAVYFPATEMDARPDAANAGADAQAAASPPGVAGHVLVVENEAVVREVTRRALEHAGFEVAEAHDGATARAQLSAGRFDVILMDISLPDESGADVARAFAQQHGGPPIIFMTGYGSDDISIPEDLAVAGFLEKPFTLEDVKNAVVRARVERA